MSEPGELRRLEIAAWDFIVYRTDEHARALESALESVFGAAHPYPKIPHDRLAAEHAALVAAVGTAVPAIEDAAQVLTRHEMPESSSFLASIANHLRDALPKEG